MAGDYILPSGRNDGTGIAVSPDAIRPEQYSQIVGVAWSSVMTADRISFVNMAIGLNSNDVADLAVQLELKIKTLEDRFVTLEQRLSALEQGTPAMAASDKKADQQTEDNEVKTKPLSEMSRSELMASYMPDELTDEVMTEAIEYLKEQYAAQGVNFADHIGLNKLFTDLTYQAEIIKKTQDKYKLSHQKILDTNK